MQETVFARIAAAIPQLQPQAVDQQEAARKQEAQAAQKSAGVTAQSKANTTTAARTPVTNDVVHGRNDLVTITNGTDTQTIKYKKAEPLLEKGWELVQT
jgi:formiminotetrahydrofolate cyclodeaminase